MNNFENFFNPNSSLVKKITHEEDPQGKCDAWNGELADIMIGLGIDATLADESQVPALGKNGKKIGYHAIAVGHSSQDDQWIAVDLSAPQFATQDSIFYYRGKDFNEMANRIRQQYGGAWKSLDNAKALIQDMKRRAEANEENRKLFGDALNEEE